MIYLISNHLRDEHKKATLTTVSIAFFGAIQ